MEDDLHVLFDCCFAKEVWGRMGLANIVQVWPNDTIMTLLKRVFQHGNRDQNGLVGLVCWNLWYMRNNWVWHRINASSFGIHSRAFSMLAEWNRAREENGKQAKQ